MLPFLLVFVLDEFAGKDTKTALSEISNKEQMLCRQLHNAQLASDRSWHTEILESLGDLFVHRAHFCSQNYDLVKSCALYNAALSNCKEERVALLNAKCKEVNRKFLLTCSKHDTAVIDKYVSLNHRQKHRKLLNKLRENVKSRLDKIQKVVKSNENSVTVRKDEEWLIKEMMAVTKRSKHDYKALLQQIVLTCRDGMGRAPCRNAFIGLDNYVSESTTSYEAVQYIILVEEGKKLNSEIMKYFRNFSLFLQMQVLALQETPMSSTGIKLFHDFYNKNLYCFPDTNNLIGFHINNSPFSMKLTPNGMKTNDLLKLNDKSIELIRSPKDMAQLFDEPKNLSINIRCQLLTGALIEGDTSLFQDFENFLDQILLQRFNEKIRLHSSFGRNMLTSLLRHVDIPTLHVTMGEQYFCQTELLEQELALLPKLLHATSVIHRLSVKSSWNIIESLRNKMLISDEGKHNLMYACALSYLFILTQCMLYEGKPWQSSFKFNGVYPGDDQTGNTPNISINLDEKNPEEMAQETKLDIYCYKINKIMLLNHYYARLLPFIKVLQQSILFSNRPVFTNCNFYKDGNTVKAHIAYRTLKFQESIDFLKREAATLQHLAIPEKPEALYDLYSKIGTISVQMKRDREAMRYFTHAIEIKDEITDTHKRVRSFVNTWYNFGIVLNLRGTHEKAIKYFKEALDMFLDKDMAGGDENEIFCSKCYQGLAMSYMSTYQYVDAIHSLKKALEIEQFLSSLEIQSESTALIKYNMAYVYMKLCDYKIAITHLKSAQEIMMMLYGPQYISHIVSEIYQLIGRTQLLFGKPQIAGIYFFHSNTIMMCILGGMEHFDCIIKDGTVVNWELLYAIKSLGQSCLSNNSYIKALSCLQCYHTSLRMCLIDRVQHSELITTTCELAHTEYLNKNYETSMTLIRNVLDSIRRTKKKKKSKYLFSRCKLIQGICQVCLNEESKGIENMEMAVQYLKTFYGRNVVHIEISLIYEELAKAHVNLGTLPEAIEMLTHSLDVKNKLFGKVHPNIAYNLKCIGDLQSQLNKIVPALNCYLKALEMSKRLNGTIIPNEDVSELMCLVGKMYILISDREQAEEYMIKGLEYWRELCNEKHDLTCVLDPLTALGNFYREENDFERAIQLHSEALDICNSKSMSHDHNRIAAAASTIAHDYKYASLYADAAKMYDYAVSMKRRVVNDNDGKLEIAAWLNCAGNMYENIGNHDRAAECHMESIELKKYILGRNVADEDVVKSLKQIASVHERRGNFNKAVVLWKQSLQRQIQVNGPAPSAEIASSHAAIAFAYRKLCEFDNAYSSQLKNIDVLYALHGKTSKRLDIAASLNKAGHCLEGLGRYTDAIAYFERALAMIRSVHKTMVDHEDISLYMCDIGHVMNSAGNSEEAITILKESVEVMRNVVRRTNNRDDLAKVLYKLGLAYESLPNYLKARDAHMESLRIWQDIHGEEPFEHTAESLRAVGRVCCALEDNKNGITHLELAIAAFRDLYGEATARPELAYCLDELGNAYAKSSRVDKALNNQTKALHMFRQIFGSKKAHLHVAKNLGNLAETCHQAQQFDQAVTHANDAINIHRQVMQSNADHPAIAALTFLLGNVHLDMKHYREAYSYYKLTSQMYLGLHNGNALHMEVMRPMKKMHEVQDILNQMNK